MAKPEPKPDRYTRLELQSAYEAGTYSPALRALDDAGI